MRKSEEDFKTPVASINENAYQLFERTHRRTLLTGLHVIDKQLIRDTRDGGLVSGDVLEIVGGNGVGKTELLYGMILRWIFPASHKEIHYGGEDIHVLFIDTDMKFSLERLQSLILHRIRQCYADQSNDATFKHFEESPNFVDFVRSILNKLFLVQPYTATEFLASLHQVRKLKDSEATIHVLLIDNISSFYFEKRIDGHPVEFYNCVAQLLKSVLSENGIPLIVTKPLIFKNAVKAVEQLQHHEHLGKQWSRFVTYRIILNKLCNINEPKFVGGTQLAQRGPVIQARLAHAMRPNESLDKHSKKFMFQITERGLYVVPE